MLPTSKEICQDFGPLVPFANSLRRTLDYAKLYKISKFISKYLEHYSDGEPCYLLAILGGLEWVGYGASDIPAVGLSPCHAYSKAVITLGGNLLL